MRWTRLSVLALVAAGVVASAAPAEARGFRTHRQLDARVEVCGAKCAPVAIGDFNGDGVDDAVFQENRGDERRLLLVHGPFGDGSAVASDIGVVAGRTLVAVDVADMNGDGQDELIVAGASSNRRTQAVAVLDFDLMTNAAGALEPALFVGLDRAPYVWTRTVEPEAVDTGGEPRLAVRAADMNGDGTLDLVLGVDPPTTSNTSRTRNAAGQVDGSSAASEVVVQRVPPGFFDLEARPGEGANAIRWPLKRLDVAGSTTRIDGLGRCTGGTGLAGVADVTGDGANDLVVRRCEGNGLPDRLSLVSGRSSWPTAIEIDGAIRPATPPVAPGPPGRPVSPPSPPPGGGYIQTDPRGPGRNMFDAVPLFFLEDLNGDGVRDIGFGMADKTHIWLGGPGVAAQLLEDRSDRIFLGAGVGGAMTSRSWRTADLDGDGDRDLALTRLVAEMGPDANGAVRPLGGDPATGTSSEPIHIFARDRAADDVIDVTSDRPDELLNDPRFTLWAFGDFNGDGHDDVMLGSPAASPESVYPILYGPFLQR